MSYNPRSQINYIRNQSINGSISGFFSYADVAGALPVDGIGGSPTVSVAASAANPLRGLSSLRFVKPASNTQGQGFSTDFSIDTIDQGRPLSINADVELVSGTYAEGTQTTPSDLTVYVYDVTNAVLLGQLAEYRIIPNITGLGGVISGSFQTNVNSTSYRLIFHCATTSALAYTLDFDNFSILPSVITRGALITDWQSFTPTGAWNTNTTYTGRFRRVGDSLEMDVNVALTGAPNAATLTVNLPPGLSVDATKLASGAANQRNIKGMGVANNGTIQYIVRPRFNSTTAIELAVEGQVQTYIDEPNFVTQIIPFTFANTHFVNFNVFNIPILGWSSSQQLSSDAGTRQISASYSRSGGSVIQDPSSTVLPMTTLGIDTHAAYNTTTGAYTVPESGNYLIALQAAFNAVASGGYVAFRVYSGSVPADNGASALVDFYNYNRAATAQEATVFGSKIIPLTAGQVIYFVPQTNSGGVSLNASARWNSFSINKIQGPQQLAASEQINLSVGKSTSQTITTGTETTVTSWDVPIVDSTGSFNATTGVYTVSRSGFASIFLQFSLATNATGTRAGYIRLNETLVSIAEYTPSAATTSGGTVNYSANVRAGDTIDFRVFQNSGGNLATSGDIRYFRAGLIIR